MANPCRLVNIPKGSEMANLYVFDNLGPFWVISDKSQFAAPQGQSRVLQR